MGALADQTVLPWPDEIPRKTERGTNRKNDSLAKG
jgi:hypothetical protein